MDSIFQAGARAQVLSGRRLKSLGLSSEEVGVAVDKHFHEGLALEELDVRRAPNPTIHVPTRERLYKRGHTTCLIIELVVDEGCSLLTYL